MFTLDEITLFFWNLSNDARSQWKGETKDKFVATWVDAAHQQEVASASRSQSSRALAYHSKASGVSSHSVPSSRDVVGVMTGKRRPSDDDTYADGVGRWAVSDNDEVDGVECEEARNSPIKGMQRATNKACPVSSLPRRYLRFCRVLL